MPDFILITHEIKTKTILNIYLYLCFLVRGSRNSLRLKSKFQFHISKSTLFILICLNFISWNIYNTWTYKTFHVAMSLNGAINQYPKILLTVDVLRFNSFMLIRKVSLCIPCFQPGRADIFVYVFDSKTGIKPNFCATPVILVNTFQQSTSLTKFTAFLLLKGVEMFWRL